MILMIGSNYDSNNYGGDAVSKRMIEYDAKIFKDLETFSYS